MTEEPIIYRPDWNDVQAEADRLADRHRSGNYTDVYGIPQGGSFVALMVAERLDLPLTTLANHSYSGHDDHILVVDDLVDTGDTARRVLASHSAATLTFDALYRKSWSPEHYAPHATNLLDKWVAFPWERDEGAPTDAVTRLLQYIGEDPTRNGLVDTPKRVVKALGELTTGYDTNIADLLAVTFEEHHDELIVVSGIPFHSLCEHHMLPFHGHATVGYVPRSGIVGLSKLARLVEAYARRLQVQERLTTQIADALTHHLNPLAVGVLIHGTHTCMTMRGIQRQATMTTSKLTGLLRERPDLRHEFLTLANA